VLSCRTILRA